MTELDKIIAHLGVLLHNNEGFWLFSPQELVTLLYSEVRIISTEQQVTEALKHIEPIEIENVPEPEEDFYDGFPA